MQYIGLDSYSHKTIAKTGVLITNLGTPDEPTPKALKRYLKEFLWDPRVVEMPRPLWWLILNGIILNTRPAKSAHAYQQVWTEQGSPLMLHTVAQRDGLKARLQAKFGDDVVVELAMRYGNPSIESVIDKMQRAGVTRLFVLPMYPQYCAATGGSTFDAVATALTQRRWVPELRFISAYHDFQPYIDALASTVKAHWEKSGRAQLMLFSFHGIPKRYRDNGDPYFCQCLATGRRLAQALGLAESEYRITFQSRFGREEWLTPYTDATLKLLPSEGTTSVQVVCPGFSADCLETIEEIGAENRGYFMEAGGEQYEYIEALNAQPIHLDMIESLVEREIGDWLASATDTQESACARAQRAAEKGATR